MCICVIKNKTTIFKCNCYVKQPERVNKKYCNGRMHAVLKERKKEKKEKKKKKSPTVVCLAENKNENKNNNKTRQQTNKHKQGGRKA